MTINYRAVHTKSPWRKVVIHKTLDSAIDGKDGAKALLLKKGRLAEKWDRYGRPLCVFVWDSAKTNGYLLRLNPSNAGEVQMIELPVNVVSKHDARESCSEVELNGYFEFAAKEQAATTPVQPIQVHALTGYSAPLGTDAPAQTVVATEEFQRALSVKAWVNQNANGICEGCGDAAPFVLDDGTPFLEVHHVRHLADGGSDRITNAVALCPNCHRRAHLANDRKQFSAQLYDKVQRLIRE